MGICDLYEHKNQFHKKLNTCYNFEELWRTVVGNGEEVTVLENVIPDNALKCFEKDCTNPAYTSFDLLDDESGKIFTTVEDLVKPICADHLLQILERSLSNDKEGK